MTIQTTEITARIYDTDGSASWSEWPAVRDGECLDDYAYRLQRWTRREMTRVGGQGSVSIVDHEWEATVVVEAQDAEYTITYYLRGEAA